MVNGFPRETRTHMVRLRWGWENHCNCSHGNRQTCYITKQKGCNIKNCFNFGAKHGDTLASFRYAKFMQPVATCVVLEPQTYRACNVFPFITSTPSHLSLEIS